MKIPKEKKTNKIRIIIESAEVLDEKSDNPIGFMWQSENNLYAQTGGGLLAIKKLKIEGKNSLKSEEFLLGYSDLLNQIFG